jgi:hypothetical protein
MDWSMWFLGAVLGGVILFFLNGLLQALLPWGTKSVGEVKAPPEVSEAIARKTTDGMMFTNEGVSAFIAVKPAAYYSLGRYFAVEFVTQLLTGAILAGVLMFTLGQPIEQRLLLVALVAFASITSIDLSYWNWWGFSNRYTLGVAVNRFIATMIAGGVVAALVIR